MGYVDGQRSLAYASHAFQGGDGRASSICGEEVDQALHLFAPSGEIRQVVRELGQEVKFSRSS